jgi:hypothetical protein
MDSPSSQLPAEQPELFDPAAIPKGHELLTIDKDERAGKFTGERIARNREKYLGIVRALAEGMGIRRTARAYGVSTNTVAAIREREPSLIETEKKDLSRLMGRFVTMATERLIEEHDQIPIGQLSVSLGIVQDKKALLDGDPTIRIEERIEVALSPGDVRSMLARLKDRALEIEATVNPVADASTAGIPAVLPMAEPPAPDSVSTGTPQP